MAVLHSAGELDELVMAHTAVVRLGLVSMQSIEAGHRLLDVEHHLAEELLTLLLARTDRAQPIRTALLVEALEPNLLA